MKTYSAMYCIEMYSGGLLSLFPLCSEFRQLHITLQVHIYIYICTHTHTHTEVPVSSLAVYTNYPDWLFNGFPQSVREKIRVHVDIYSYSRTIWRQRTSHDVWNPSAAERHVNVPTSVYKY
jgi:hypothetical protein